MRISARTDYALRVLLELAADSATPQTCEGVAVKQDIPYRYLKSIVSDLRKAGLVVSQRGSDGGYWIARDPAEISVAQVVTAVDGSVLTVRGELLESLVYTGSAEHLGELWAQLGDFVDALFATSIAQLMSGRVSKRQNRGTSRPAVTR